MPDNVLLRAVRESDLPIFHAQQVDPEANYRAAFTARDWDAFQAHWHANVLGNASGTVRTIEWEGHVIGNVVLYEYEGLPEVGYWLGREYRGLGLMTRALGLFLAEVPVRPIYAHLAKDNLPSVRVLEKCGFVHIGEGRMYAATRGEEIAEAIMELRA